MSYASGVKVAPASVPVTRTEWKPDRQMMSNVLTHAATTGQAVTRVVDPLYGVTYPMSSREPEVESWSMTLFLHTTVISP